MTYGQRSMGTSQMIFMYSVEFFIVYYFIFFFSSRRRHTRFDCDWSSDVCSSDLEEHDKAGLVELACPAIDELDPHGGLACPDGPFNQSDVASRDAPFQDRIQTADPGTREIFGRRHEIHCLGLIRHWDFRHAVGGGGTAMRHLAPSPVGLRALD